MVLALHLLLLLLSGPVVTVTPLDLVGGPLPVACGLLSRLPPGFAPDRPGFLVDGEGRAVPAVFHRHSGVWTLHALVEEASGPTALSAAGSAPRRPPRGLVLGGDTAGRTVTTGGLTWELGPGSRLATPDWEIVWFPEAAAPGPWRVVHLCPLRAVQALDASAGAGRRVSLHVTHHAGTARADTARRLEAGTADRLPQGGGVRVVGPGPLTLILPGGVRLEPGEEPRRLFRTPGGWSEGEHLHPADGSGRFRLSSGPRELSLLASPTEGEAFTELLLEAGGRSLVVWALAPGQRLARGEGQILRVIWDARGLPPAPRPLVVPARPAALPWTGERLAPRPGSADALLWRAADEGLDRFLEDPAAGRLPDGSGIGDWLMPDGSVGNQEYDAVLAFATRAFRGEPRALAQAPVTARVRWRRATTGSRACT